MPTLVELRVTNGEIVRKGLERLRRKVPSISRSRLRATVEKARQRVIKYPPPLPNQRYKRTGTYRKAWRIVVVGASADDATQVGYALRGEAIQRGREYTKYVGGDKRGYKQALIHKGRWVVARVALVAEAEKLPKSIQDDIIVAGREDGLDIRRTA